MAPPILHLDDIFVNFGGTPLLGGASLMVHTADRICLVGRNGSGKSTLMKIAAGLIEPDSGRTFLQPGTTIRYLSQEHDLSDYKTVGEYIEANLRPTDDRGRVGYLMRELDIVSSTDPNKASGGEIRRAALVAALAAQPDILMLDEPTNHLDLPAIKWLEKELSATKSALIVISHDRRLLENISRRTAWLDRGKIRSLEFGFAQFEDWRDAELEHEETERHKLGRKIAREEHWITHGVSGRRKRNMRRVAELKDLRRQLATERHIVGQVALEHTDAGNSGKLVARLVGVTKSFDGRAIICDLSAIIRRGDRLGIVGANGVGKTTLVKLITGEIMPDDGTVHLGTNLQVLTVDQKRVALDPALSLRETLSPGGEMIRIGDSTRHIASYMKDFLFLPEQAGTSVGMLSGGERARLLLARGLAQPSNLLVLDEPTNDLDLESLDLLQEFIGNYSGTAIVVSHDRDFLDRVCTQVLVHEKDGIWLEYAGGYSDMVAQRGSGVSRDRLDLQKSRKGVNQDNKPASAPNPSKLSFKQIHALKTLPADIERLEREVEKLKSALADPQLYSRDQRKFDAYAAALKERESALAQKEEQWLELELLREALER